MTRGSLECFVYRIKLKYLLHRIHGFVGCNAVRFNVVEYRRFGAPSEVAEQLILSSPPWKPQISQYIMGHQKKKKKKGNFKVQL